MTTEEGTARTVAPPTDSSLAATEAGSPSPTEEKAQTGITPTLTGTVSPNDGASPFLTIYVAAGLVGLAGVAAVVVGAVGLLRRDEG